MSGTAEAVHPPAHHTYRAVHARNNLTPWVYALASAYLVVTVIGGFLDPQGVAAGLLSFLAAPVGIGLFIIVSLWTTTLMRDVDLTRAEGRRWDGTWAFLGWVIPFANLVVPYLIYRELWQATGPTPPEYDWRRSEVPAWLTMWWVLWAATVVIAYVLFVAAMVVSFRVVFASAATGEVSTVAQPAWFLYAHIARSAILVAAFPLFLRLVHTLPQRLRDRALRMDAWITQQEAHGTF